MMSIADLKSKTSLPLIAAPMFLVSGTRLVTECCKNGIIGTFPSLNGRSNADFESMLQTITSELEVFGQETGRIPAPFGVNLIVNRTNPRLIPDLELCIKYKVPLVITSLGTVKEIVDAVHGYGGMVFHDIVRKRHAEKAAEAGVDGIICVAAGAGGHAGIANPFALVAEIRSFFDGAVILAGGIHTGAHILAAEVMGADFAYMGTRFIATEESMAQEDYKEMITRSGIDDIVYTDGVSGVPANFLKESIAKAGIDIGTKKEEDFSKLNGDEARAWRDVWSAGHGVAGIQEVLPAAALISLLKEEYIHAKRKIAAG